MQTYGGPNVQALSDASDVHHVVMVVRPSIAAATRVGRAARATSTGRALTVERHQGEAKPLLTDHAGRPRRAGELADAAPSNRSLNRTHAHVTQARGNAVNCCHGIERATPKVDHPHEREGLFAMPRRSHIRLDVLPEPGVSKPGQEELEWHSIALRFLSAEDVRHLQPFRDSADA